MTNCVPGLPRFRSLLPDSSLVLSPDTEQRNTENGNFHDEMAIKYNELFMIDELIYLVPSIHNPGKNHPNTEKNQSLSGTGKLLYT